MSHDTNLSRKPIIAVDFDGTLFEDDYPSIGEPNLTLIQTLKTLKRMGIRLILWTCRNGEALVEAINACAEYCLEFDAVNENLPEIEEEFGGWTRKVYATIYIDDKAIPSHQDKLYWLERLGVSIDAYRNFNYPSHSKLPEQSPFV